MLELLKNIGLTESESKVYLALLDLGTTTIGPIADKSDVSYSKIYLLLEKLIHKGLASYIAKEKTKYFTASNPKKILEYLQQKKNKIDELSSDVQKLLPQLEAKHDLFREKEYATVYEGYEGLKTIYYEGMEKMREGQEILLLGATMGISSDEKIYPRMLKKIHQRREEKKIGLRVIFNQEFKNNKEIDFYKNQKHAKVRFLLNDTSAGVNIQADRVLIIYWQKQEPKIFVIKSTVVADSFRKYFEVIWQQAKS
jgi:HTH-type transcriptional regulator, sugar sensing transcriptional regulator